MADRRQQAALARCAVGFGLLASGGTALADDLAAGAAAGSAGGTGGGAAAGVGNASGAAAAGVGNAAGTGLLSTAAFPGSDGPIVVTPSILQPTGFGPAGVGRQFGGIGNPLGSTLAAAALQGGVQRAWTLTPSVSLSEEYVTGANGAGGSSATNQFITILQPAIFGTADTTRLHGELSYAPQLFAYSRSGSEDQVAQNFNGRLLATLLPQTLFLDLRGSASEQAITPGQAPIGTVSLPNNELSQAYSFSVSPYAIHRFADYGTAEVGGSYVATIQSALQPSAGQSNLAALAAATNQNVTTTSGHLAFVTGEAFARYNGAAEALATSYDGTGVLQSAYRNTVTLDSGYALTRTVIALVTIGWEDIHYSGSTPITIDDAIWDVGLRLLPNADSAITLRYGHHDGLDSIRLNAAYQPTARIRLYASYSEGLTTQAEQLQNALATSDLDALGNPVDHTTGAPLLPVGSLFGVTSSLYRTALATLTAVWTLGPDTISASFNRQDQTLVSASNTIELQSGNSLGSFGSLAWSHMLRPNLTGTAFLQYGTSSTSGVTSPTERVFTVSSTLSYALSPTLTGRIQYSFSQTSGQVSAPLTAAGFGTGSQSVITVNLVKTF
jgi:uncharacterized protein (PEP-CTERM system associated)